MSQCRYCSKTFQDPRRPNSNQCNSCSVSKRRWKNKIKYVKMLGGKCIKCGYNESPAALQFHHVSSEKSFEINSNNLLLKEEKVKDELNKCILMCANCHATEHSNYERFK